MTGESRRLPPRHALPRDVAVPPVSGLGLSWYDRGPGYWGRRAGMALLWAVLLLLVVLVDAGIFGAIHKSSAVAFYVLLAADIAVSAGVVAYFAVQTARRWNVPALPKAASRSPRRSGGLAQAGLLLAQLVAGLLCLVFPGLFLALFLTSLLPETPVERQARLWVAEELGRRGYLAGASSGQQ